MQRAVFKLLRTLLEGLMRLYFRLEVRGKENIPATGPFILAPVHRSFIDTPLVSAVTPRVIRYMGKEAMWDGSRFMAFFLTAMGGFPVQRGSVDRDALRAAQEVLERGEPLVMFPEGTRREGEVVEAEDMHDGPAFVASRTQVPVVPVGVGGSARALPLGAKVPRPRKVIVVVGEPLTPPELVNGRAPRKQVRAFTEEMRTTIQQLFDDAREQVHDR
ncbi:MAG: 1-acyl-sn-glycerol-3-phosphate acyltransferase [Acidimicrobiia bacterium]|nr:1-acyl-sn-glycerol-3-phosphate acyltransferase [Acidimicrobiia bacterium]